MERQLKNNPKKPWHNRFLDIYYNQTKTNTNK